MRTHINMACGGQRHAKHLSTGGWRDAGWRGGGNCMGIIAAGGCVLKHAGWINGAEGGHRVSQTTSDGGHDAQPQTCG
jgi:hypothetical protein